MNRGDRPPLHIFPKIDPGTGKRWGLADQGQAALDEICGALNSETKRELRMWLRAWVAGWSASGPNLKKLVGSLPDPQRMAVTVAMRTIWYPTDGAKGELHFVPDFPELERLFGEQWVWRKGPDGKRKLTPEIEAMTLFLRLTVTSGCEKIAGPCPRCDRYYIKQRASQKVYCSRRCGNATTATARTRKQRQADHADKLRRTQAATRKWTTTRTQDDWKVFVSQREPDITPKFLTRAVNKGELKAPVRQ